MITPNSNDDLRDVLIYANTSYLIKYSFILPNRNGPQSPIPDPLIVPAGCTLIFEDGGAISDGQITFNRTFIEGKASFQGIVWGGELANTKIPVQWFGAKGDGVTDDTNAINHAMVQTQNIVYCSNENRNAPSYTVVFDYGKRYVISSEIKLFSGLCLDMNGSTLCQTNELANALVLENSNQNVYGCYWNIVRNGIIEGPGRTVSLGTGLRCYIANHIRVEDVFVKGFKIGISLIEVQYSLFSKLLCEYNQVGLYLTARSNAINLTTIDNSFDEIATARNDYGIWLQTACYNHFSRVDTSRNYKVDLLFGEQLNGYVKNITLIDGGNGYTPDAILPLRFTNCGARANGIIHCFALTNHDGEVEDFVIYTAGLFYSNLTEVSILDDDHDGEDADFMIEWGNDSGIGEYDGHSQIVRGSNFFDSVKIEHIDEDAPASGYSIITNAELDFRGDRINNLDVSYQGTCDFAKLLLLHGCLDIDRLTFPTFRDYQSVYVGTQFIDISHGRSCIGIYDPLGDFEVPESYVEFYNNAYYMANIYFHSVTTNYFPNLRLKMGTPVIDNNPNLKVPYVITDSAEKTGIKQAGNTPTVLFGFNEYLDNRDLDAWGYRPFPRRGHVRPTGLYDTKLDAGFMFFDRSIGQPIWWNGQNWIDANGDII